MHKTTKTEKNKITHFRALTTLSLYILTLFIGCNLQATTWKNAPALSTVPDFSAESHQADFTREVIIHAPVQRVWETLGDIGNIYVWNPGVDNSYLLFTTTSDKERPLGIGSRRRCVLGKRLYLEEVVVEWLPESALTMHVTDSNIPLFKPGANIRFTLETLDANSTRVSVSPDYQLKYGLFGRTVDFAFFNRSYRNGLQDLLNGLKTHVEQKESAS